MVPIKYLLENPPNTYSNTVKVFPDENLPYGSIPNQKDYKFESGSYPILFYKYKDYVIWGMTAKILENFLNFYQNNTHNKLSKFLHKKFIKVSKFNNSKISITIFCSTFYFIIV